MTERDHDGEHDPNLAVTLGMMSPEHADAIQSIAYRLKAMRWRLQQ